MIHSGQYPSTFPCPSYLAHPLALKSTTWASDQGLPDLGTGAVTMSSVSSATSMPQSYRPSSGVVCASDFSLTSPWSANPVSYSSPPSHPPRTVPGTPPGSVGVCPLVPSSYRMLFRRKGRERKQGGRKNARETRQLVNPRGLEGEGCKPLGPCCHFSPDCHR